MTILSNNFFNQDGLFLAKSLLGKVLRVKYISAQKNFWLSAQIIETEAYELQEKGSHASLGKTLKRSALFMPAGTIYMYYSRAGDSLNISASGEGNAVLIKSAFPFFDEKSPKKEVLPLMQALNPRNQNSTSLPRSIDELCKGQALLCRSLHLKVKDWDQQCFDINSFYIEDCGYYPQKIIQARRLGIPTGRDEHLLYRFIDYDYAAVCTSNPLKKKSWELNKDYFILENPPCTSLFQRGMQGESS